ncbi:MAG: Crp/Fnr family transcriptional regulator [Oscillospiraceae bacterium]
MKDFFHLKDAEPVKAILAEISFLGGLSDEQLDRMYGYFEVGRFRQGEFVEQKGEDPSCIFIIQRGSIDLLIEEDGESVVKRTFRVGECFGEVAMLAMINDTASFVAAEDSELLVFTRRALNLLHKESPELFSHLILNLAREIARKLQYTDHMLLKLGLDSRKPTAQG